MNLKKKTEVSVQLHPSATIFRGNTPEPIDSAGRSGKNNLRFLSSNPNRPVYALCLQRHADAWLLIMDMYAHARANLQLKRRTHKQYGIETM
jgi:hypothetical protein